MKSPFWKWLGKQRWRGDNVATLYHCLAAWQPGYGGGPVPTLDHREAWVAYTWVACQGNWDLLDWLETAWSEWLQSSRGEGK